ncbi:mpv17-like protein 2 isoform X3 [Hyalella azteca]|uniref:Mpv17-like protein 2 isoform X3 n=1 Tax=Hyalella azteca TaxID=294128 RepID=A0A979FF51_HYAAZ|nr:mpv17-like protein 2 isoform X3 [Hyalella azteca]
MKNVSKLAKSAKIIWQTCFSHKNLWVTNTLTCGTLFAVGDVIQQQLLPQKTAKTVFKKILMDQFIAAPFFAVTFFLMAGLLEGKDLPSAWQEFKTKFPAVYMFDWIIWPPSQAINFLYVPTQYRVLYVNAVTVLWDVFLSHMKHYDQHVGAVVYESSEVTVGATCKDEAHNGAREHSCHKQL